jgi:hypothetical protein
MRPYYTFHTDPGHGWLAVPERDLADVGLSAYSFSRYSFRKSDWFYLEEDCDMAKFMEAFRARFGELPKLREQYANGNSPIRRYRRVTQ